MARMNRAQLIALVESAADQYGIDRQIAVSQIQQESGFAEAVVYGPRKSSAGAMGIAQFIPGTAARFALRNPYDPAESMQAWGKYMTALLRLFGGRYDLALAGYNWGEGSRTRGNRRALYAALDSGRPVTEFSIPAETRNYVTLILRNAGRGVPPPPTPTPPPQKKT